VFETKTYFFAILYIFRYFVQFSLFCTFFAVLYIFRYLEAFESALQRF